jgi:hypothetical protein
VHLISAVRPGEGRDPVQIGAVISELDGWIGPAGYPTCGNGSDLSWVPAFAGTHGSWERGRYVR